MMKAIVIDDEQHCIERLQALLLPHLPEVQLVASFQSVEEGLRGIEMLRPELVFLDIQIGDKTGFDLLKAVQNPSFNVIFTTAFDKYAVQAFRFSAVDYLLKPIDAADLAAALQKVKSKISTIEMAQKIEELHRNMNRLNPNKRISVSTSSELIYLPIADIVRCESTINYTTIYLRDNRKIIVAKTLKEYEELLSDFNFFRIHNSHLVNLTYIKSYNKGKGGSALLIDGTELEVSTRRKEEFLEKLAQL